MSNFVNLNWIDLLKGLVVAILGAIITAVYEAVQSGTITFTWVFWQPILFTGIAAGLAYLIKNFFTNSSNIPFTKEGK
ncbi:MAG: hypothetical protein M0P47_09520 [Bacteroidales bacterium]|nr:hypothetical protein [Bacteroidales bacterium]